MSKTSVGKMFDVFEEQRNSLTQTVASDGEKVEDEFTEGDNH